MSLSKNLPEEQKDQMLDWLESNVLNHPEYGKQVKKILKSIDSRVNFPEVDLEATFETKTKEQDEKIGKFVQEQKDKENKTYWEGQRKQAQDAGYVSGEERDDFEKWMISEHLGNYQRAARMWHDEKHAAAEPTNYQDMTGIQLPAGKGLFENPRKFARDEALSAINDLRRQRVS
jgi:broad specificity polyphosphatase/5'/3'-nucleotidase SurE